MAVSLFININKWITMDTQHSTEKECGGQVAHIKRNLKESTRNWTKKALGITRITMVIKKTKEESKTQYFKHSRRRYETF